MTETPLPQTTGLVGWMERQRTRSGTVLLIIGLALLSGAGVLLWLALGKESTPLSSTAVELATAIWVAALAIAFFIGAGLQFAADPLQWRSAAAAARVALLLVVGVAGMVTFFYALVLLYLWGDSVTKLVRDNEREGAWRVLVALGAVIGGLFVMFIGLQAARVDERRDAGIRRAVYGFNAFLTAFLLFAVLVIINILVYLKFPVSLDTTKAGIHTLNDASKKVLHEIDRPVTIYTLFAGRDSVSGDVQSLLALAQEHSAQITVEQLNPLVHVKRVYELAKTFPQITEESEGVLVVYGDAKPENSTFVRASDLEKQDFDQRARTSKRSFLGEQKLMTELSYLVAGKDKPIIYITQGFGEADLNDSSGQFGLGLLKDRLERRNYDIRPLKFAGVGETKVPDDAKIVVIAGPLQTYPATVAQAFREFVDQRGGKLLALFDTPDRTTEREMPLTGLEALMTAYGVEVTREKIQTVPQHDLVQTPDFVVAQVDRQSIDSPIGAAFRKLPLVFINCRVVRPARNPEGAAAHRATSLLAAYSSQAFPVFTETNLQVNVRQTIESMFRDPKVAEARIAREPLPIAVTVTDVSRGMPGEAPAADRPRMAVFGDATFVCNARVGREEVTLYYDLFVSTLNWLRERPANIGIEPRVTQVFEVNPEVMSRESQMKFLPLLFAMLGIIGLGTGVWLVRRQ